MLVVSVLSDYPKEWGIGLDQCHNLSRLREFGMHWGGVCIDAWEIIRSMKEVDFNVFRGGLNRERKGLPTSDVWMGQFGAILMPELLLRVSLVAERFGVPWGTAWIRCEEAGIIRRDGDLYVWVKNS